MKDGYYWVRGEGSCYYWIIASIDDGVIYIGADAYHIDGFEIGDYIETPEKYRE